MQIKKIMSTDKKKKMRKKKHSKNNPNSKYFSIAFNPSFTFLLYYYIVFVVVMELIFFLEFCLFFLCQVQILFSSLIFFTLFLLRFLKDYVVLYVFFFVVDIPFIIHVRWNPYFVKKYKSFILSKINIFW